MGNYTIRKDRWNRKREIRINIYTRDEPRDIGRGKTYKYTPMAEFLSEHG